MTTQLAEVMASGVLVEFLNESGRCVGQRLYVDWRGRPLPDVGDTITCAPPNAPDTGAGQALTGLVCHRHIELQHDEHEQPCVWVRLDVAVDQHETALRPGARFSMN